jgi:tetratricopeptide (TPR) repeat protein
MKRFIIFLFSSLSLLQINAQTLEEGKKSMYYENFRTARSVFEKLVAASPDNANSVYWLGQAIIAPDERKEEDVRMAKSLYLKALDKNSSNGLLLAGIGHMELLEGKTQDARSHFETAISLSEGKDLLVLNAIGFANGNPDAKNGDLAYAVDKLKRATQIKGMKDPDVWTNLGDAYRKQGDGGNAILSYQQAMKLDPKYARALFRSGRVYESQGAAQEEIFMKYYNDAIAVDPNYGPVYNNLYRYYFYTNVSRSAQYLEQYLKLSDLTPESVCFKRTEILYQQGLFSEAVLKAKECLAAVTSNVNPKYYGILAMSYHKLNDSVQSLAAFQQYVESEKPEKISPSAYMTYATVLLQFEGRHEEAGRMVDLAVAMDSLESNKVIYLKKLALHHDNKKNHSLAGNWFSKVLSVKSSHTKTDIFNPGYAFYRAGDYAAAVELFNKYTEKFPDDLLGHYFLANMKASLDSNMTEGLAVPHYEKLVQLGDSLVDKTKEKSKLMEAYLYLSGYQYLVKKDQEAALLLNAKALELDPQNEQLLKNREIMKKNKPGGKNPGNKGAAKS